MSVKVGYRETKHFSSRATFSTRRKVSSSIGSAMEVREDEET